MTNKVSKELQQQALNIAKGTQKQGQTKEQTKLIAQGIEKGIAEYKKQQNKKARERDKQRKHANKAKEILANEQAQVADSEVSNKREYSNALPWLLLVLSWLIFIIFWLR